MKTIKFNKEMIKAIKESMKTEEIKQNWIEAIKLIESIEFKGDVPARLTTMRQEIEKLYIEYSGKIELKEKLNPKEGE
jgi:hypothetical protein